MVELVGHTTVDGTVGLDVNNVSDLVGLQVGGDRDGTLLTEVAGEKVPGAGAKTCSESTQTLDDFRFSHDRIPNSC